MIRWLKELWLYLTGNKPINHIEPIVEETIILPKLDKPHSRLTKQGERNLHEVASNLEWLCLDNRLDIFANANNVRECTVKTYIEKHSNNKYDILQYKGFEFITLVGEQVMGLDDEQ